MTTTLEAQSLAWREVDIQAATPAVTLARLPAVDGVSLLVRFPAGWSRPGLGHYTVAEEVLFLAGSFEMSGHRYLAGDHGWFPAGYSRRTSGTSTGALAWAWFSGRNEWFDREADEVDAAEDGTVRGAWTGRDPGPIDALGLRGRPLRVATDRATYLLDALPEIVVPTGLRGIEAFDLATHAAASAASGERLPAMGVGPVLLRVVSG